MYIYMLIKFMQVILYKHIPRRFSAGFWDSSSWTISCLEATERQDVIKDELIRGSRDHNKK